MGISRLQSSWMAPCTRWIKLPREEQQKLHDNCCSSQTPDLQDQKWVRRSDGVQRKYQESTYSLSSPHARTTQNTGRRQRPVTFIPPPPHRTKCILTQLQGFKISPFELSTSILSITSISILWISYFLFFNLYSCICLDGSLLSVCCPVRLRTAMCISKQSTISYSHRLPFFLCFPYFILSPSSFHFQIVTFHCLKILQNLWVLTTSLHSSPRYFYVLFFLL